MSEKDILHDLCLAGLNQKGYSGEPLWIQRLAKELKDIDAQGEHEYFLKLHNRFRLERLMFPINEHNNLVDYVLDLAPTFDITKESAFVQGESPDIDIDYLKFVRDYLKRIWAAKTFGQEKICEIGTYGTSGIKSAIKDTARLYSCSNDEINNITNKMEDKFQDDDGNTCDLEWDDALKIYPEFAAYCDRYPEVAHNARLLLDRNKSAGVHAGGLVISSVDIDGFVPLEVRSVTKDNPLGVICAAWTEGLNRQDLGPVGLIKFDLLVINNLMQIAIACKLIKERHGIAHICALPGDSDWSDISYLNDPKSIKMANEADLKCIFQFGSEGIRKLVKRSGVTSFDDIPAISSLYRPGPLGMGMDVHYCKRKKWSINPNDLDGEPYNIHPKLQQSLGYTYGVMCYQEQVMDILSIVGLIPDMHTEKVRKAISKKKIEQFAKYKDQFIKNGQIVLGVNEDYVVDLWNQIESFAEYGFNKSVLMNTKIPFVGGIKEIKDFIPGDRVYCINENGKTIETDVVALHDHGELEGFEVTFDDGYQVTCSANHKFLTEKGQVSLREICKARLYIMSAHMEKKNAAQTSNSLSQRQNVERGACEEKQYNASEVKHGMFSCFDGCNEDRDLELGTGHAPITNTGNLVSRKIVRVRSVGKCHMFDLEVANPTHNFLLPNGIVTSNSHSYAYSYISARLLWLKSHYPLEFYAAILQSEKEVEEYKGIKLDAMRHGIEIHPVHINKSKANFEICDNKIYFGFQNIKTIGEGVAQRIVENQPYKSFADFLDRFGTDAAPVKALVALGVFEEQHDRITMRKFSEIYKKQISARKDRQKRNEASLAKKDEELRALLHQEVDSYDPEMEQLCQFTDEAEALWIKKFDGIMREVPYKYKGEDRTREVTYVKQLQDLKKKRQSSIELFNTKESAADQEEWITFDNVNFNSVTLDSAEEAILMDELVLDKCKTYPKAESMYYGFQWVHRLETHPDYQGRTLTKFLDEHENQAVKDAMVEVEIKVVKRRESKPKGDKKPVEFYSIEIEDADGKKMFMNIWMDDYTRFEDDLKAGNLVKMRVRPPGGGFNTLTFESVPRNERRKLGPKDLDPRLQVMKCADLEVIKNDDDTLDNLKYNSVLIPME